MHLSDILAPDCIACQVEDFSKKRVIARLASLASQHDKALDQQTVFDSLISRERLGSTSIGQGVALPHSRLPAIDQAIGCLVQLKKGIDFDAIDNEPVDLFFSLLVPEQHTETHLQLLSQLAEMFSHALVREQMRHATTRDMLYESVIKYGR